MHEYILIHVHIYVKSDDISETDNAQDREDDADEDEGTEDDDHTGESIEEALGSTGDLFGISGGEKIFPGGQKEIKEKDETSEEEDEGNKISAGKQLAEIPTIVDRLAGVGERANINLCEFFHEFIVDPGGRGF